MNNHLRRIEIEGGTLDQQRIFYSCLYRTLLFPRIWHEPDTNGVMQHRSPYTGAVTPASCMLTTDTGIYTAPGTH